jgi:uncharacterized protein (DUF697 family)
VQYGHALDQGHIREFLATVGVGMTSQVLEGYARKALGKFAKKFGGKGTGKLAGVATGAAMSFATTWALGQAAKQYYAGGRRLSAVDLQALFAREVERGRSLYAEREGNVQTQARTLDLGGLMNMVRGR